MTYPDRWEHGSDYHWPSISSEGPVTENPWCKEATYWATGRHALIALMKHGPSSRRWARLWVPTYFCQSVVSTISVTETPIYLYPDSPLQPCPYIERLPLHPGDAMLVVNYFGLRSQPRPLPRLQGIEFVEDHTHDPWSAWAQKSDADWCLVSLRKTLPLPDGAVLWSPRGHALPEAPPLSSGARSASLDKMVASQLKALYLAGMPIRKETFRNLSIAGEDLLRTAQISRMTPWSHELLKCFPTAAWREQRAANYAALSTALAGIPWLRCLSSEEPVEGYPFSAVLLFDSGARRDYVRSHLIESRIYPAVLWDLERPARGPVGTIPPDNLDLSRRIMSLHCDYRYTIQDMERVADTVCRLGMTFETEVVCS